ATRFGRRETILSQTISGPLAWATGTEPMSTPPSVTEKIIRDQVGERNYNLGEQYYDDGAVLDTRRQENTLKAKCEGQCGGPYRVEITFAGNGIQDADCSCPVGSGGSCKHVAAVLLAWKNEPNEFQEVENLETALERRSKAELIALVKQMLRREPDLESLLETPLPAKGKRSQRASADVYQRQV